MFLKLYLALALIFDAVLSVFCFDVNGICDIWIPVIIFAVCFIGFILFHIVATLIIYLFIINCDRAEKPVPFFKFWTENTVQLFFSLTNVKISISGINKLPDVPFLLVSNHRSCFDPMALMKAFCKFNMIFISKPENFKIPVAGSYIKKCAYLPIDRENARNAMRTLKTATDYVLTGGSVCIYPEGTRSKTCELLEFKDGVFYVAKKADCPVVVVTTENTEKIAHNLPLKRTKVEINVLSVLTPDEISDMNTHEISEKVKSIMLKKLGK